MLERFPIDELLERLRTAGFEVSVADHLLAFRLMEVVGGDAPGDELRIALRSLFTSSEEEQQRFDDVFRSVGSGTPVQQPSTVVNATAVRAPDEAAKKRPGLSRGTWIVIAFIIVLVAVLALAAWEQHWFAGKSHEPTPPPPSTDTSTTISGSSTSATTLTETTASISTTHSADTSSTHRPAKPPPKPPVNWVLLGAFITFLVAFGVFADTGRWLWRRYDSRGIAGHSPPFEFQRPPDSDSAIFESQAIQQAATALRGRLAGERLEMDLPRSIRATIDGGGFPNLHFLGSAQSPEYLALIDRRSPDDHLATYFELLVEQLTVCGAAIDRYTFDGDPRVCMARDGTIVEAGQLRAARPTAKLLLFTDAAGLFDARTGVAHSWVARDLAWDQRALLLPAIPQPAKLMRLSTHFAVERADAAGLLRVAQRFASATVTHSTPASDASIGEAPSLAQLRRMLSTGGFRWLTACAVQRSLEWNATMAAGRAAHPDSTEKDLLELVRLGWFRHGSIPEAVREELLAILGDDAALARAARNAVAQELRRRSAEAPRGSFAAEILLVEAVAHDLASRDGTDPKMAGELRRVDPELVRRDSDLPRLLAPDRTKPPSRWSRLRFRGGFPTLGPSAAAYTVLMVTLAVLVAAGGGMGELTQRTKAAPTDMASMAIAEKGFGSSQTDTVSTGVMSGPVSSTDSSSTLSSTTSMSGTTSMTTALISTSETTSATETISTPVPPPPTPIPNPTSQPASPQVSPSLLTGCSATATSRAANVVDLTFTGCGEFVPRSGETVNLGNLIGKTNVALHVQTTQVNGLTVSLTGDSSDMKGLDDALGATLIDVASPGGTLVVRNVLIQIVRSSVPPSRPTDISSPSGSNSVDLAVPVDKSAAYLSIANPEGVSPSDVAIEFRGFMSTHVETSRPWQGPTEKLAAGLWTVRLRNDFYDETQDVMLVAGESTEVSFHEPKYGIVVFANTAGMRGQVIGQVISAAVPSVSNINSPPSGDLFLRAQAGDYVVEFSGVKSPVKVIVTAGRRTTMEVIPQPSVSTRNAQNAGRGVLGASTGTAVPRTSFVWDGTENESNTWLHTEWTRQRDGSWQHMQENRGNVTTPQEIARQTSTWRETGRATVDSTSGVIVAAAKSDQEVFIPDFNGGKRPSVVLIRDNAKASWQILVDLSFDHRL